jgi:hypothetical protein
MIKFTVGRAAVVLEYQSEMRANGWVWRELKKRSGAEISQVFRFLREDLLEEPPVEDQELIDGFEFRFRLASADTKYYRIAGRKLKLKNDVLIAKSGIDWSRKLFAAERNVSIFLRISKLVGPDKEIVVGGDRADAIPIEAFAEMLKKFPNSLELDRYASARVANIIGEYLDPQRDFRAQYEQYLSRRKSVPRKEPLRAEELIGTEIEKFELVRDTIRQALISGGQSEEEWQKMLLAFLPLIFPKYVAVIEKVPVEDRYTNPDKIITRMMDLALVDVNGNIDVIEIKKPFDDVLLRKTPYRDNFVPTGDLSGTIMQAEKYLFHLSKWGIAGEKKLTEKYQALLPPGLQIRITNPKALLILGRDRKADGTPALNPMQLFDLEVIKRKYANMVDIITYDDLLRRLENIIASLRRRSKDGLDATTPP